MNAVDEQTREDRLPVDAGPRTTVGDRTFCCQMRAKFKTGIIAIDEEVPCPMQAVDYIVDWNASEETDFDASRRGPRDRRIGEMTWLQVRFCPFCGEEDAFFSRQIKDVEPDA